MNFQQLRIVRETVRRNYNLTEVANALFTSQSGVSKHIRDLEDEIGVELFVRRGKRLLGLRVVRLDGRPVGLWALPRTILLMLVVPAMMMDRDLRGLQDKAAGTVVIQI